MMNPGRKWHRFSLLIWVLFSAPALASEPLRLAPSPAASPDPFADTRSESHPAKKGRKKARTRLDDVRNSQVGESIRLGQPAQTAPDPKSFHQRISGEN